MNATLVMTIIGDDRPGIVDRLSTIVTLFGANWVDSQMARLGGKFAGILRVDCPSDALVGLQNSLASLDSEGLEIHIEQIDAEEPDAASGQIVTLEIVGQDRPGIVSQITHAIAKQGVNVEKLETGCESAPMSGEILFRAAIKLRLPDDVSVETLQRAIEKIATDLVVDVNFPD